MSYVHLSMYSLGVFNHNPNTASYIIRTRQVFSTVVVVVVVVFTLTRIIKSVVTGQAPVTLELRNTPGKNTTQPKKPCLTLAQTNPYEILYEILNRSKCPLMAS